MRIEKTNYETSLVDINNIRYLLFRNLYGNTAFIQSLTEIITRNIDCLGIDYSASEYTFTIRIKKTTMRKMYGFYHDPNFYYSIIPNIFKEFIETHEPIIISILREKYADPFNIIQKLYMDHYTLSNLCHVSCISDNILVIKL
mgnify:CR=1 FL=1